MGDGTVKGEASPKSEHFLKAFIFFVFFAIFFFDVRF
jgi:hypothetical protein